MKRWRNNYLNNQVSKDKSEYEYIPDIAPFMKDRTKSLIDILNEGNNHYKPHDNKAGTIYLKYNDIWHEK